MQRAGLGVGTGQACVCVVPSVGTSSASWAHHFLFLSLDLAIVQLGSRTYCSETPLLPVQFLAVICEMAPV